ncbi:MAG: nuclear transport factor 2 family protein [Cyclobacteriaceae bacterium]|nr:nuclear transport factor 2 family protein [Cyclobacteriaceae bacterium]
MNITFHARVLTLFTFLVAGFTNAQETDLYRTIATLDSLMFTTLYKCNPEQNEKYFTEDLEFYHDKDGPMISRKIFMEAINKNFCGSRNNKLRREVVPGTMKVFPLENYGAVQTGEHYFFETYKDNPEKRVGIAKFTHIWRKQADGWRISRVISYDHQPMPE